MSEAGGLDGGAAEVGREGRHLSGAPPQEGLHHAREGGACHQGIELFQIRLFFGIRDQNP